MAHPHIQALLDTECARMAEKKPRENLRAYLDEHAAQIRWLLANGKSRTKLARELKVALAAEGVVASVAAIRDALPNATRKKRAAQSAPTRSVRKSDAPAARANNAVATSPRLRPPTHVPMPGFAPDPRPPMGGPVNI